MIFLRTLLIFVLGISVVAASPVSPMRSSIHRRTLFGKVKNAVTHTKPLPMPSDANDAKPRLNGLWTAIVDENIIGVDRVDLVSKADLAAKSYDVYLRITNGELRQFWPEKYKVTDILVALKRSNSKWTRAANIKGLEKAGLPHTMTEGVENTEAGFREDKISTWTAALSSWHCPEKHINIALMGGGKEGSSHFLCVQITDQRLLEEINIPGYGIDHFH